MALLALKQDSLIAFRDSWQLRPFPVIRIVDARVTVGYVQMTHASRRLPRNTTNGREQTNGENGSETNPPSCNTAPANARRSVSASKRSIVQLKIVADGGVDRGPLVLVHRPCRAVKNTRSSRISPSRAFDN